MLRILLNIGVGLGVLMGAGRSAVAALQSGETPVHSRQQSQQLQPSQVTMQVELRTQTQAIARSAGGELLQNRDCTQVRECDQLRAVTQEQLQQREQLRLSDRAQLRSQMNTCSRTQPMQRQNQP